MAYARPYQTGWGCDAKGSDDKSLSKFKLEEIVDVCSSVEKTFGGDDEGWLDSLRESPGRDTRGGKRVSIEHAGKRVGERRRLLGNQRGFATAPRGVQSIGRHSRRHLPPCFYPSSNQEAESLRSGLNLEYSCHMLSLSLSLSLARENSESAVGKNTKR